MSDNVLSTGFMALLVNAFDEYPSEKNEELYENDTNLQVNYEGSMVFSDHRGSDDDIYGLRIESVMDPTGAQFSNADTFAKACEDVGLPVIKDSIRRYSCYWYNGSDSDMSDQEAEDYKRKIGL